MKRKKRDKAGVIKFIVTMKEEDFYEALLIPLNSVNFYFFVGNFTIYRVAIYRFLALTLSLSLSL